MYKNMYASAYLNVKKINFDLRNKISQRITRNGSDVHIDYRRTAVGQKAVSISGAKLFNSIPINIRYSNTIVTFKSHMYQDIEILRQLYTLSGRIGKVVASHVVVPRSIPLRCTDLYYARGAQRVLPMRVGGATSQLDLPSLTPLSVAGCG